MVSKTFKTCILSLLLIAILHAQDAPPPNPNPSEHVRFCLFRLCLLLLCINLLPKHHPKINKHHHHQLLKLNIKILIRMPTLESIIFKLLNMVMKNIRFFMNKFQNCMTNNMKLMSLCMMILTILLRTILTRI